MHDPSSQPSQLNTKYVRKLKISNKTLKLQKLEKFWENSSYLDLILRMRWESFKTLRDLAKNYCGSVWVERKSEKIQMNRV
jgi:hypothetical protein